MAGEKRALESWPSARRLGLESASWLEAWAADRNARKVDTAHYPPVFLFSATSDAMSVSISASVRCFLTFCSITLKYATSSG